MKYIYKFSHINQLENTNVRDFFQSKMELYFRHLKKTLVKEEFDLREVFGEIIYITKGKKNSYNMNERYIFLTDLQKKLNFEWVRLVTINEEVYLNFCVKNIERGILDIYILKDFTEENYTGN